MYAEYTQLQLTFLALVSWPKPTSMLGLGVVMGIMIVLRPFRDIKVFFYVKSNLITKLYSCLFGHAEALKRGTHHEPRISGLDCSEIFHVFLFVKPPN